MNLDAQQIPLAVVSAAMARPDHPALQVGQETVTWSTLRDGASRAASVLAQRGLGAGDRIALVGPISIEWVVALHAVDWLGGVLVPLPFQAPLPALNDHIRDVNPAAVVASEPGLFSTGGGTILSLEALSLNATRSMAPMEERPQPLEEARALLMTSGSSGTPRWNPLTTRQIIFSAFGSAIRLGHHRDDRWLSALPLHHVGGLSVLWRTARYGTTAVVQPHFEPAAFSKALDEDVHLASMVPDMLRRVLDARGDTPFAAKVRALLVGGAATDTVLRDRCRAISAPVALTWGMTETASQVATTAMGAFTGDEHVGAPLPFTRVRCEDGTLTVHGPTTESGTWRTRDLGHVDLEGHVHVQGRADHVISSGGESFSPESLEAVLRDHPDVQDVGVTTLQDARWGQRPVAWLVAHSPKRIPTDATMTAWIRERVSAFKVPAAWRWTEALPRTVLGKLRRAVLASWTEQAHPDQRFPHVGRDGDRREVIHVDEDVHVTDGGAQDPIVSPHHTKGEGQGSGASTIDGDLHAEALPHAHGVAVVGLGVGQRHAPDPTLKDGLEVDSRSAEELLVGHVTVLEHTTEERDPRTVDLLETNRDDVLEGHDGLQGKHTNKTWEDAR